ncbi:MAG: vitamin B12-dependent ribonucleotide reductase [Candidatus Krumholzibacteria bacterium]|nr:vitamin B12-dependent ribonucleotide reductase [Candidatus Krumholzibacteria bacterium]MDP6796492.1 vitamin B12-dependent ribonucleotide reductase [Candidatus Krumholzibacteria bacterium]MDP7021990.1 vitamin B12-dependent ribonucleotide reductase [Candidatus Krumholzibacteria bacterium]
MATTDSRALPEESLTRQNPTNSSEPVSSFSIPLHFSRPEVHPFDDLKWERREAQITDENNEVIFEQKDVEVPAAWSMLATKVVVSKYFYGENGTPEREYSVRQLIHRVARTLADWGREDGYFNTEQDAENFYREMVWLTVHQYGAYNSPVWFNLGLFHVYGIEGSPSGFHFDPESRRVVRSEKSYVTPQLSACFIQAVDDNMEDIMRLATSEAMLFKYGSGTGTDLSTIRSSREKLSGGGTPSGPLSFMRVYDQIAAVVKSGGKTRRAAKMQSLRIDHPDVLDFINAKRNEEEKAWALIEQGYDGNFNGDAYSSVMFQNSNFSVRCTEEFFRAVEEDSVQQLRAVTTGEVVGRHKAREILRMIAEGTHICGDPGLQYHSTINDWNTCPNSGTINASNPCSEYMFIDNSACNLASLNLMKFRDGQGRFDVEGFRHATRLFILAQDIIVDRANYPVKNIALNSHLFRPLGLGYANLGTLIMSKGLPYDSDEGRSFASAVTALMGGEAYATSAELASVKEPFAGFEVNREPMLEVMEKHRSCIDDISQGFVEGSLLKAARESWDRAISLGQEHGYRNSQTTLLAPTGTIGFMMDCDTTGVEPDIALVKYKLLAGGGLLKIVNRTVPQALQVLGYSPSATQAIVDYINENDTIEGAPYLKDEHLPVFDCAFKPAKGVRSIHYMAHLKMMSAAQPFLSGAISKTVNVPNEITVDELMEVYLQGWKLGLKAVAVYRDGSKRSQPLNTSQEEKKGDPQTAPAPEVQVIAPARTRLPDTRKSVTHKFNIQGHEGYLTVGQYDNGEPGELFITMAKEGSTIGGLMDTIGTSVSLGLQYGVPLKVLVDKFVHSRFEPSGFTQNPDIPMAKSLVDYIFRWLGQQFVDGFAGGVVSVSETSSSPEEEPNASSAAATASPSPAPADRSLRADGLDGQFARFQEDAPSCDVCGSITVRNGNCYRCYNCGNSMGCS